MNMNTKNDTTTPERDERAADSALIASPGSVFELRDTTDDEIFHMVGMFRTKQDALDFLEQCDEPWALCEYVDDYAKLTLQEVPFCVGAKVHGEKVWERTWVLRWEDDEEDTWDIYSPNARDEGRKPMTIENQKPQTTIRLTQPNKNE